MVRDFPRQELLERPDLGRFVLVFAPVVQTALSLSLDLLRRIEDNWFICLGVCNNVILGALSGFSGLNCCSCHILWHSNVRLFGVELEIVLHQHRIRLVRDIFKVGTIPLFLLDLILTVGVLLLTQLHRFHRVRVI